MFISLFCDSSDKRNESTSSVISVQMMPGILYVYEKEISVTIAMDLPNPNFVVVELSYYN